MLPESYIQRIKTLLGDEADDYLDSFNKKNHAGLRVNTLKTTIESFKKISPVEITNIPWTKKGFYYSINDKPAKHPYYYAGLYYIQEPSAMAPASILPIDEHDKVLDLCAAPGGKSTELAAKLENTGLLVSNDISASRAKALLKNIEISGIKNAVITNETPYNLAKHFGGFFDKILVDAPCSGEGMFRKDPSIIKSWEQYGTGYYSKLQKEIILYAADMLKPGGYMVYSTCTFSPEEDEGTLRYLIDNRPQMHTCDIKFDFKAHGNPEWLKYVEEYAENTDVEKYEQLNKAARLWPHKIDGEGHFVALLKKDEDASIEKSLIIPSAKSALSQEKAKEKLPDEFLEFLKHISAEFDYRRFLIIKDRIYYIPEGCFDMKGIKVLRNGLLIGEIKTKRFVPSQALASSLNIKEFDNVINLSIDDDNVIKYLKGESIELTDDYYDSNGMLTDSLSTKKIKNDWCLICVDGYSLGFAKLNNNMLKNKYLPGWRWM